MLEASISCLLERSRIACSLKPSSSCSPEGFVGGTTGGVKRGDGTAGVEGSGRFMEMGLIMMRSLVLNRMPDRRLMLSRHKEVGLAVAQT